MLSLLHWWDPFRLHPLESISQLSEMRYKFILSSLVPKSKHTMLWGLRCYSTFWHAIFLVPNCSFPQIDSEGCIVSISFSLSSIQDILKYFKVVPCTFFFLLWLKIAQNKNREYEAKRLNPPSPDFFFVVHQLDPFNILGY